MSIKVKDLKKGMRVFECEYGMNLAATILEDARKIKEENRDGWIALAKTDDGEEFEFFHTGDCEGPYAPKIYADKQYISRSELDAMVKSVTMES